MIQLIEGSSTDHEVVKAVREQVGKNESVLVLLDSNHSKSHVAAELEAYAPLVSKDSYIIVCDGIMQQVEGGPRTNPDWQWNNPISAIQDFLAQHPNFEKHEPEWPFNEGKVQKRVTYWPTWP